MFTSPGHGEGEEREVSYASAQQKQQVNKLDLLRCQTQSSLLKQVSAMRCLPLYLTSTTVSQSIASALLIQNPATPEFFLWQTAFWTPKGDTPFHAETRDMQKQNRLWEGSAKLPESILQISSVWHTVCKQSFLKATFKRNDAPFQIRSLTGLTMEP